MGLDLGTTGVKILVADDSGEVVAKTFKEYPLYHPEVGWAEQDPTDWWEATIDGINEIFENPNVRPGDIEALGLTGQMHGSIFLDEDNQVLRPAILWCDQRTSEQCDEIIEKVGRDRLIELASNPPFEGFTAPKILWVMENEPEIFEKSKKILLPKDYIRFKLTGDFATDVSDASGTLLLNVGKRDWSDEILEELNISRELLPEVYESPEVTGEISKEASEKTGLSAGTPVVAGAGDNEAGAVGTGVVEDGDAWGSIGTSGVIFVASDKERTDPEGRVHTFCHAVPGKWHIMGVMLAAGGSLRWFKENLGRLETQVGELTGKDPYQILDEEASNIEPGAEGLIFLPYLNGERTPYRDSNARGVFFGLSSRHKKSHLVRSVMEGVTYGMRDSLRIVRNLGIDTGQLKAAGGGAKSPLWRQIQADIFGADIVTPKVDEGPAYGSALLAGVGAGVFESVEDACDRAVEIVDRVKPIEENTRVYDEYYHIYRSLYKALKDRFVANINTISKARDILEK